LAETNEVIDGQYIVAIVPARGGSKSVPYKNLHPLGGRPLLAWPIESARSVPEIDRIFVSTDDQRIADAGVALGAEIHRRPAELATDTSLVIDTLRHLHAALVSNGTTADIFLLLEATSPLRSAGLIQRCLQRLVKENLDSIATFHEADVNPERIWRIEDGRPRPFIDGAIPWKPRQQLTPAYQLNGAVYAFRPERLPADGVSILFGRMGAELVPASEVIDIDEHKDFVIANALLESRNSP
jgi:CMP-N,N'-diacetyllegionaminic acid synthase